jgi:organic radical activating enzyme
MLPHQSPITFYPTKSAIKTLPEGLELKELMVYLKTTETCQLNCKHCFTNGINGKKIYFDPQQTVNFLHKLHEFAPNISAGSIAFHGGEPMLAPVDSMMYVYNTCKDLWPNIWWTTTTNLTYKLTVEKLALFKIAFKHGISTSWDNGIRFENDAQEQLWAKNVRTLLDDGHEITLIVSLSKSILAMPPEEFLAFVQSTGVQYLQLERKCYIKPTHYANQR